MAPLQDGRDDMKSNQRDRCGTLPDCFTFFHRGQAAGIKQAHRAVQLSATAQVYRDAACGMPCKDK